MTTPNSNGFNGQCPKPQPEPDCIDQAVTLLQKFSVGDAITSTDPDVFDQSDATALVASVGIAIAVELRRIADVLTETATLSGRRTWTK